MNTYPVHQDFRGVDAIYRCRVHGRDEETTGWDAANHRTSGGKLNGSTVGHGSTPQEAIKDLQKKLDSFGYKGT